MRCPSCGAPVYGSRFCESCGALVSSSSYASSKVAPAEYSAASAASGRGKTVLFAILGVLLIVLLAVGAVAGYKHVSADPILYYGSSARVECSSLTRFIPYDAFDEMLTQYSVHIRPTGGQDELIEDEMPSIEVSGDAGFSLGNFGSVPDGGYLLEISDDLTGATYELEVWHDVDSMEAEDRYELKYSKESLYEGALGPLGSDGIA